MCRKRSERRRRGLKSGKAEVWALKEREKTGEKHEKGGKLGGRTAGRLAQRAFA